MLERCRGSLCSNATSLAVTNQQRHRSHQSRRPAAVRQERSRDSCRTVAFARRDCLQRRVQRRGQCPTCDSIFGCVSRTSAGPAASAKRQSSPSPTRGTGGGKPEFRARGLSGLAGHQWADDELIHLGSLALSNSRCHEARRADDVSPPSNQTPVRARDTAT